MHFVQINWENTSEFWLNLGTVITTNRPFLLVIRNACLNFLQSVILGFFQNISSRVINMLLIKLAQGNTVRIWAIGKDVRPIFSPHTCLIKYTFIYQILYY